MNRHNLVIILVFFVFPVWSMEILDHWAFKPVKRPVVPRVDSNWPNGNIDNFVLSKLLKEGMQPAIRADRRTLIRRISFNLTGLPPTQDTVNKFVHNNSANAYQNIVDEFLFSPRFWRKMGKILVGCGKIC